MDKITGYMKEHPWATGIIIVVGGIIFFLIFSGGGGSSTNSDGTPKLSDAEIAANAQISAAQIAAQAQAAAAGAAIQQAQIGAGVQMASDKLSAEVAMHQLDVQQALGLGQQGVDKEVGLANIAAQRDVSLKMYQTQVDMTNAYTSAQVSMNSSNNKQKTASGIIGTVGGLIGSIFSDQRLKENITYLGDNAEGMGIYEFNYKGSNVRRRGVIAQDVARSHPELVFEDKRSGYEKVRKLPNLNISANNPPAPAMIANRPGAAMASI